MSVLGLCVSAAMVAFVAAFFLVLLWSDKRTEPGAKAARLARRAAKRSAREHERAQRRGTCEIEGKPIGSLPGQPSTAYQSDQTTQPGDET